MEVDYFAPLLFTRALLPALKTYGKIIMVSSACALFALRAFLFYAYIRYFSPDLFYVHAFVFSAVDFALRGLHAVSVPLVSPRIFQPI